MCKGADLIGRELFSPGGKRVLITEGQDDMLAAAQMLSDRYPDYLPVVVSLPFGTTSKLNTRDMEFLNSFDSVHICMDNDDPGHDAVKRLSEVIGDKVRVVKLKEDPNSMLLAGNQRAFVSAYFDASEYRPDGFVTVEDVWADATKMPVAGRDWPWPSLNALTYGRRDGEGAYIGAGVKIGKTQAMLEIVYHTALVQKTKIAVFALEQEPAMTVRKVAGRIKGLPFHRPDGDFTQEQLEAGVKKVDNVVLYKAYGSTAWDEIKAAIRYAVVVQGCKDVIIDPLTRLTTGMDPSDANTELERVADEISSMAKDLGFFYIFFCHLKAPPSGIKSHEEGGKVKSAQFTGSRAMMRACYYMVGLERDKSPDREEVERNTTKFVLLEDRAFGNSGAFDVFYNRDTGAYLEPLVGGSDYADF
jgi:twinkle protein